MEEGQKVRRGMFRKILLLVFLRRDSMTDEDRNHNIPGDQRRKQRAGMNSCRHLLF